MAKEDGLVNRKRVPQLLQHRCIRPDQSHELHSTRQRVQTEAAIQFYESIGKRWRNSSGDY